MPGILRKMFKKLANQENKKLISNFLSLAVLRGFDLIIPLVTLPYLLNAIGIELYGELAFALSLAMYFGSIIQYGFGVTAVREISQSRSNHSKISRIYSRTLTCTIILTILCTSLFLFITFNIDRFSQTAWVFISSFLLVAMQSLFPVWLFQGMERMTYIAYINLSTKIIFLLSLFIFVKSKDDYLLVPVLNAIAASISFISSIAIASYILDIKYKRPSTREILDTFKNGKHGFISQIAPSLYNNTTTFALGIFSSSINVGIFSAACKLIDAINSAGYIIGNTFLPRISRDFAIFKVFQWIMISTGLLLSLLVLVFPQQLSTVIFASNREELTDCLMLLAGTILLAFLNITYGTTYLICTNQDRRLSLIMLSNSLIFFIIGIFAIKIFELEGAIFTLIASRFFLSSSFIANYLYSKTYASKL